MRRGKTPRSGEQQTADSVEWSLSEWRTLECYRILYTCIGSRTGCYCTWIEEGHGNCGCRATYVLVHLMRFTEHFNAQFLHFVIFERVRKIAKGDCYLRHSYLSAWKNSALTGRIFMKFDTRIFFKNCLFWLKSDKSTGHFTWRPI